VSLAQHGRGDRGASVREEKPQGVSRSHEPLTSDEERTRWSAEPGCSDRKKDTPDHTETRSWTLVSPDGLYKAYAVNEAIAERSDGEISACKSTTKLFVAGPGQREAKAVLVVEPSEEVGWENSIELIDWSREGHRLVVIQFSWLWATDSAGVATRVYDADSGKMSSEGLFYDAFEERLGRKCGGAFDPIGFSADGQVVARTYPDMDYDRILEKDSCVRKVEVWGLDPVTRKLRRLTNRFEVRRYGVRESQNREKSPIARNVPSANPLAYSSVRTTNNWLNPFLIVCADGIEIVQMDTAAKRIVLPVTDVMAYLEKLPRSAWPYGLVVGVMENGLRGAGDDIPIEKNRDQLLRLLKEAGVKVDRWPSA
jgi:hypothetical protein